MPNQQGVPTLSDLLGQADQWSGELQKQKQAKELAQQQQQYGLQKQEQEHTLKEQGAQSRLKQVLGGLKSGEIPEGAGISVGPEGASVTRQPTMGMYDLRKENMIRQGMKDYSKRIEHHNGFTSALKEIENLTNREGTGGILTSPNAKLQSTGKLMSSVPTGALGLAEMLGVAPKGGAEERKSLERLQLEYQKAMTGMRTSEEMRKAEKQALGWIASGDPDLVTKGVRALARNVQQAVKTVKAGYMPDVRERVEGEMGDPEELLSQVISDQPGVQNKPTAQSVAKPNNRQVVKTEVSPSTGKKRITYSDGSTEIK